MQKGKILSHWLKYGVLKTSTMLKALILKLQKYNKIEDLQAQVINRFHIYS
jgi:hypothetical protein